MAIRILEGRIDRVRQQQEAPAGGAAPEAVLGAGAPPLQTPEQEVGPSGFATRHLNPELQQRVSVPRALLSFGAGA